MEPKILNRIFHVSSGVDPKSIEPFFLRFRFFFFLLSSLLLEWVELLPLLLGVVPDDAINHSFNLVFVATISTRRRNKLYARFDKSASVLFKPNVIISHAFSSFHASGKS